MVPYFFNPKFIWTQNILDPRIFLNTNILLDPNIILDHQFFGPPFFWTHFLWTQTILLDSNVCWTHICFGPRFFWPPNLYQPKKCLVKFLLNIKIFWPTNLKAYWVIHEKIQVAPNCLDGNKIGQNNFFIPPPKKNGGTKLKKVNVVQNCIKRKENLSNIFFVSLPTPKKINISQKH